MEIYNERVRDLLPRCSREHHLDRKLATTTKRYADATPSASNERRVTLTCDITIITHCLQCFTS